MKANRATLISTCNTILREKIELLEQEIKKTQASANEETKSSAGDKYETGRAMAQLEIGKLMAQQGENVKMLQQLEQLSTYRKSAEVKWGSLVRTDMGVYFISISLGRIELDNQSYFLVSAQSPIGQQLLGKSTGETLQFNNRKMAIIEID